MKNKFVLATSKKWFFRHSGKKFLNKKGFVIIYYKEKLRFSYLKKINPKYIFFPHWSYKIEKKIIDNFNCIGFHTGNLPFEKGGSPIQNLIKRNRSKTYVNALKLNNKIDGGDILLKKKIFLSGNLEKILNNISIIISQMIKLIIQNKFKKIKQKNKGSSFKRITSNKLNKNEKFSSNKLYNLIRMRDAEEYEKTYLKFSNLKIELSNARLNKNKLKAIANIFINDN